MLLILYLIVKNPHLLLIVVFLKLVLFHLLVKFLFLSLSFEVFLLQDSYSSLDKCLASLLLQAELLLHVHESILIVLLHLLSNLVELLGLLSEELEIVRTDLV